MNSHPPVGTFYCPPRWVAPFEVVLEESVERIAVALLINLCAERGGWQSISLTEIMKEAEHQQRLWTQNRELLRSASAHDSAHRWRLLRWMVLRVLTVDGLLNGKFYPRPQMRIDPLPQGPDLICIPIEDTWHLPSAFDRLAVDGYVTVERRLAGLMVTPLPLISAFLVKADPNHAAGN